MAQYTEETSQVNDRLSDSGLSQDSRSAITNLLNSQTGDTTAIQEFDGTPPDEGTTILTVGSDQNLTDDPGTPVIIMDDDAPGANVTLDAGTGQDRILVAGGGNDNIQFTGDGNVTVETGGGNDTVETGSGNDTVVITGPGNSSVSTGDGDDTIVVNSEGEITVNGGDGNDTIVLSTDQGEVTVDGGDGFDQLVLNDSRGSHTFSLQDGVLVMNSTPTEISNVEAVQFDDGISVLADNATEAAVARMYEVMFDREADLGGLEYWLGRAEEGASSRDIANGMAASEEFSSKYSQLSNEDVLDSFYQNAFDREADAGGKAFWLDEMSDGLTEAQVAESFGYSQEAVELMGIDGTQYVIEVFTS
jgi:Ca2+-binding RTX toxin-like protein